MAKDVIVCSLKSLPRRQLVEAAERARDINPANHPQVERLAGVMRGFNPTPMRIAVMTVTLRVCLFRKSNTNG